MYSGTEVNILHRTFKIFSLPFNLTPTLGGKLQKFHHSQVRAEGTELIPWNGNFWYHFKSVQKKKKMDIVYTENRSEFMYSVSTKLDKSWFYVKWVPLNFSTQHHNASLFYNWERWHFWGPCLQEKGRQEG